MKTVLSIFITLLIAHAAPASKILIPMGEDGQANHLKAYGVVYAALQETIPVDWLVNYKSGSFCIDNINDVAALCDQRGVTYSKITNADYDRIVKEINNPANDCKVVRLDRAPKIAVYTPPAKEPWDDAVTLALAYAEIPFDKVYADEVLEGRLAGYDWLHLHHEDFTGEYSKFWMSFHSAEWYIKDKQRMEDLAAKHGFKKVSQLQLAVVKTIRNFVGNGGNLFAMCSATETFDVALAAEGMDICDTMYDGDPPSPDASNRLSYTNCFAFRNFSVYTSPYAVFSSDIDNTPYRIATEGNDYFTINTYSAKTDVIPAMLCQVQTNFIKGFMGRTTAFRNMMLKPEVLVMGYNSGAGEARYIHGEYRKGAWTYYGGHDPEDYMHLVEEQPTDLSKHPNSPGYRLILNNLLLPASGIKPKSAAKDTAAIVQKKPVIKETSPAPPTSKIVKADTVPVKPAPVLTKIEALPQSHISIALDPSGNGLLVSISNDGADNEKIEKVSLLNYAGKEVIGKTYNATRAKVDMSLLPAGTYRVVVNGGYAGQVGKE